MYFTFVIQKISFLIIVEFFLSEIKFYLLTHLLTYFTYFALWSWFGGVSICGVAGDVSSGGIAGDLLMVLVCKHVKTNTAKMPMLKLSTSLKIISYQIFLKYQVVIICTTQYFFKLFWYVFFLGLKKTVHVTEMKGIISYFLSWNLETRWWRHWRNSNLFSLIGRYSSL